MPKKKQSSELFSFEQQALEAALFEIQKEEYRGNALISHFRKLADSYERFLRSSNKIFKISDLQGKELKRKEIEIKSILDNCNQGFLTFGPDMLVNSEFSQECTRIFNRRISHVHIRELICSNNAGEWDRFEKIFQTVFQKKDAEESKILFQELPIILKVNDSFINIKYKYIDAEDAPSEDGTIMLVLTDITEKQKAEDQILYLSCHDKLTSLYNRAYVDSILPQLQSESNMPMSIIMADMNGLKLTNDVFGHEKGDQLLVRFAEVLSKCCRKSDIIARWGGDEFLIFLPNTDREACQKISRRIKDLCQEAKADPIQLSVSVGIATMENAGANLAELLSVAENMMYSNKLTESKAVRRSIILSLGNILHSKCFEFRDHTERIKEMALRFAGCLNISEGSVEWENLSMLAVLHDIGKVAIPKEILGKAGPLTENEWKIMQSHTEIGFRMAQSIDEPALAQAILAMREHWDGTGYPYALKGNQIPWITRIIAIVDAYDIMTHDRPYKKAISYEQAILELEKGAGVQFDPELIRTFLDNPDIIV